jgi:Yip1 domain
VLPLLLLVVVGIAVTTVITERVGWRTVIDREIASNLKAQKRMEQLPPEKRDEVLDTQAKFTPYVVYAINVLFPFIVAVAAGAIFLAAFNLGVGAKITLQTSMAVFAYAWVPASIAGLLGILVLFLRDPATVDVKNLVASNPGALMSDDSPKWLVTLLTSLDLFSFWTLILLAIGYRAADPKKISFGMALGAVVGVWLIFVIIRVGWVAAFS